MEHCVIEKKDEKPGLVQVSGQEDRAEDAREAGGCLRGAERKCTGCGKAVALRCAGRN